MDIPIDARVQCIDGEYGRSTCVIIDPATECITHVVVADDGDSLEQRLVSIGEVTLSTPDLIQLRCRRSDVRHMDKFIHTELERRAPAEFYYPLADYLLPSMISIGRWTPVSHEQVPPDELALHPGTHVDATDGRLGEVEEFLVDAATDRITHLVVQVRHPGQQRLLTIPVTEIDHMQGNTIYLKSDKRTIEGPLTQTLEMPR